MPHVVQNILKKNYRSKTNDKKTETTVGNNKEKKLDLNARSNTANSVI